MVLVRDLDSRLSGREAAAVHEWLNDTRFSVHVMRYLGFETHIYMFVNLHYVPKNVLIEKKS